MAISRIQQRATLDGEKEIRLKAEMFSAIEFVGFLYVVQFHIRSDCFSG